VSGTICPACGRSARSPFQRTVSAT
jgi:hypothetical protein